MQYNSIIFDWDGTLGMTLHLWLQGYRESLALQNHSMSDTEIVAHLFNEHKKARLKFPDIAFDVMVKNTRDFVHDNLPDLKLYPGARDTLEALHAQGVSMALVSSSNEKLITSALSLLGLGNYFASVIGGDEVTFRKPHPEAFLTTIAAMEIDPAHSLIIGDTHTDIEAGKAAGLQTCLYTPPENLPFYDFDLLHASRPDYAIDALPKLLQA